MTAKPTTYQPVITTLELIWQLPRCTCAIKVIYLDIVYAREEDPKGSLTILRRSGSYKEVSFHRGEFIKHNKSSSLRVSPVDLILFQRYNARFKSLWA